jgi:DNA-directed RNA polymerase beta subunit/DNA-directed RNA polymerase beta' subunit
MPISSHQDILKKLSDLDASTRGNVLMNETVKNTVEKILSSVENPNIKLQINKTWYQQKYDNDDISAQQSVRNKHQNWVDDIRADVSLIDKLTGKVIDRNKNLKITSVPKLTPRNTYLLGGNEYSFTKQSRLKPGVYTKRQENGEISSFFNVDKTIDFDRGFNNNFKLNFNPERKTFTLGYGSKNIPLYNALKAVGVKDEDLVNKWGKDVVDANRLAYEKHEFRDQSKLYEAIFGKQPSSIITHDQLKKEIKDRLFATKLSPETTKLTLGKEYDGVNTDVLLDASKKIIDIHKGEAEGDDRESLLYKSFFDVEDHIRENLVKKSKNIIGTLIYKLEKTKNINKSISSSFFDPYVSGTITQNMLSSPPSQINIMSMIGDGNKITVMGEGGIGNQNAVTNQVRQISNSEAGFIDPLHTPEGGNIGITNHLSVNTIKVGNDLYSTFKKPNGEIIHLRPIDTHTMNIAFPDQYDLSGKIPKLLVDKVKVLNQGKFKEVNPNEVDAIIGSHVNLFDASTNMIPFLDSIQGNRGLTASKMQEQALSLKYREKPLFNIVDEKGHSLNETLGRVSPTPRSPVDGEVISISPNQITIQDNRGNKTKVQLYNNFSLNAEGFIHNEPVVKIGDRVKKDQLLADNNNTKDGQVALGTNLKVAYMPYKGYNYEDSAIMSESAAKKLTSQHIYDFSSKKSANGIFSKNKFRAYYPEVMSGKQANKLDADGVIQIGQEVDHGDVIIAHLERKAPTADDIALGRLEKQLRRDMANNATTWDNDHKGVVTNVEKHGNTVTVSIKTEEPLKIADKISGLHGNKHIISKIIPDHEMPLNPITGEHIDLTMSPLGVSNRINTSQLLEAAAGKIATKTGKQYEIRNFTQTDNTERVLNDLKKNGLSDKDILIDPATNQPFKNPIMNGIAHILKLEHKVDHKFSARYRDGHDSNEQAITGGISGGKNLGRMEVGALLARGATENLKEMYNIKGQKNNEYWKALETGSMLPPPVPSFVWNKQIAMMQGAGINVIQKGKQLNLKPLTDEEIKELSNGKLDSPTETYRKKDLAPIKGGLFDPVKAGGMQGEHYTHFELPEKILNPITATAAATMLDMSLDGLENIINGKTFVDKDSGKIVKPGTLNAFSGGPAVEKLLSQINVNKELEKLENDANIITNKTQLNKVHRKIRYFKALKQNKMQPTDYMIKNVLVVPAKYRPMFTMGTDNTVIMSDVNNLYQQTAYTADALNDLKTTLDETVKDDNIKHVQLAESRGQLYQDVKALTGLREPTAYLNRIKNKKGFIAQIDGGTKQTKEGFFQDKVLDRRQDLVGRSTIILNPELGGDQLGIPKLMANKIFQPFIMQKLVSMGYSPLEAQKQMEDETSVFQRARQLVADERLVIANRAPTLHRWNMTAFKPVLTDGKSIEVPGIVVNKNFGGDFDGDCNLSSIFIRINNKKNYKNFYLGEDLNIDFPLKTKYIKNILNQRKVCMPSLNRLMSKENSNIYHFHISEFPRIKQSRVVHNNGNEEYDVPKGVTIFTIDNVTHKFIEVPVIKFSIHKNLENYNIEFNNGDTLWLSFDQSAIAINMNTFELERVTPNELINKMVPKIINMETSESIKSIELVNYANYTRAIKCKKEMILNEQNGWLIGAMIGDGWTSVACGRNDLCIAATSKNITKEFDSAINNLMEKPIGMYSINNNHKFDGFNCSSSKHTKTSLSLTRNFIPWIGEGAYHKHLPPFFMSAPKEFRLGLLAGLLDTDGTVCWMNKKGGTRQFNTQYSTVSDRLAEEMVTLCRSLDISASITFGNKVSEGVEKRVVISTNTLHNKNIKLRNEEKLKNFNEFCSQPIKESSVSSRLDLVPFSADLFMISKEFIHYIKDKQLYNNINDSKSNHWVLSRQSAKKLIAKDTEHKLPQRWIDIVNNENVTWIYAKNIKLNPSRMTMYDITAPGPYTFMLSNGIIVQDTFQIHVPIGSKAIEEAKRMTPSASMLKTGFDTVLNKPDMDMVVGSWLMSKGKGGENTNLKYNSIDEARKDFRQHKFTYADSISIEGKKAPFGIHEINSVVPEDVKKYDIELNGKNIEEWIKETTEKHSGNTGLILADKIKDIGNNYSTTYGYSLGLEDVKAVKNIRDPLVNEAEKEMDKKNPFSIVKAIAGAKNKMLKMIEEKLEKHNPLTIAAESGGGKGFDNSAQIIGMPGIVLDAEDNPIPMPITKSYSEGLDTASYWAAAHGARGGNIKKSIQSYKPGWMTKDLMNAIYDTRIYHDNPVDNEGLEYNIDNRKHVINRYLAKDIKDSQGKIIAKRNDVVDDQLINKLNKIKINTVFIQSPLTDPTPGDGISSWSYGVEHDGKRLKSGDHIGVMSAHTITEPSLNMAMKSFHTGGAITGKEKNVKGTLFDALDRTLRFTQAIPNKATMAPENSIVKSINKSSIGGWDVILTHNDGREETRYIEPANTPVVKIGDKIKKGDILSTGNPSMHDILKYKGMKETQKFLVNELDKLNDGKLDRRNLEVIVRGITNTTRVLNPGDSNYTTGDTVPLTTIEDYNKNLTTEKDVEETDGMMLNKSYAGFNQGTAIYKSVIKHLQNKGIKRIEVTRNPIIHDPFLSPAGIGGKIASSSEDWIARMAHNRIESVLKEGATQGWNSKFDDKNSNNPISLLVSNHM